MLNANGRRICALLLLARWHAAAFHAQHVTQPTHLGQRHTGCCRRAIPFSRDQQVSPAELISLISKAVAARGAADLDAMRALSRIMGMGKEADQLEASLGLTRANETDKSSAYLVQAALEMLGSQLVRGSQVRAHPRRDALFSVASAVILCETFQFALVTCLAWIIGGGVATAASSVTPLQAATHVAAASRQITRPARFAAELWSARLIHVKLGALSRRARKHLALRCALGTGLVLLASGMALVCIETILTRRRTAIWPVLAGQQLQTKGVPPIASFAAIAASALSAVGFSSEPRAAAQMASHASQSLLAWVCEFKKAIVLLAYTARKVKPLRALLDLTETDAWAYDTIQACLSSIREVIPWQ